MEDNQNKDQGKGVLTGLADGLLAARKAEGVDSKLAADSATKLRGYIVLRKRTTIARVSQVAFSNAQEQTPTPQKILT